MKSITVALVLLITFSGLSQTNDDKVKSTQILSDSIDNMISNSSGFPGDLFCNTITMKRNVRAIGMQETKISFYFMQKEDSVYDDGKTVQFIPRYNPPLKVHIEYNIAASQSVIIDYYFDTEGLFNYCHYISKGEYGYEENKFMFYNYDLINIEKYNNSDSKPIYEKNINFTKEDYDEGGKIMGNETEYRKLYYNLFRCEIIDK